MSYGSFLHANLIHVEKLSSSMRTRRYLTLSVGFSVRKLTHELFYCFIQRHLGWLVGCLSLLLCSVTCRCSLRRCVKLRCQDAL